MQQSFTFTLYLLKQYGQTEQTSEWYADIYIKAFPALLHDILPTPYLEPKEDLKRCYTLRTLKRFVVFLGLEKVEHIGEEELLAKEYRIQKLPLLDKVVSFPKGTSH